MINLRTYGTPPFKVAVIHGGPGARGELAPVAKELSRHIGVLEPLQTAVSVEQQLDELKGVLQEHGKCPLNLIGHSWGAWLGVMFAARCPDMVRKLILVGAGPFEEEYAAQLTEIRLGRLTAQERGEVHDLQLSLNDPNLRDKLSVFARFGRLMSKADSFDIIQERGSAIEFHPDTYERVWSEAKELRRSGELLRIGEHIRCPVVAIHGDYDPHPADGVRIPLARVLKDFRFELLKKCGHTPWHERHAQERFYEILKSELV
ncbi:MAG: alpha/beta hydrolase [Ignavibacteria bacterium]|nr:alpha/beta hydrolase [Ignavibacteria bacterium]